MWRRAARYAWAPLLARIYEVFPLLCPLCGAQMRIVAFITDPTPSARDLAHLGEPIRPPIIAPARGPPARRYGTYPMPDGTVSPPTPSPHRSTNSINASTVNDAPGRSYP
jgi:hypothetical protein